MNILTALGCFWNISSTIMGILILAPANSIGDFVADFSLAKAGKAETAFGAVYGGPLLNVLIGIGLSCTIAIFANGHPVPLRMTAIEIAMAATARIIKYSKYFFLKLKLSRTDSEVFRRTRTS